MGVHTEMVVPYSGLKAKVQPFTRALRCESHITLTATFKKASNPLAGSRFGEANQELATIAVSVIFPQRANVVLEEVDAEGDVALTKALNLIQELSVVTESLVLLEGVEPFLRGKSIAMFSIELIMMPESPMIGKFKMAH